MGQHTFRTPPRNEISKAELWGLLREVPIHSVGYGILITFADFIDIAHRCIIAANIQFPCVRGES